jgi:hypothetical protein
MRQSCGDGAMPRVTPVSVSDRPMDVIRPEQPDLLHGGRSDSTTLRHWPPVSAQAHMSGLWYDLAAQRGNSATNI